MTTRVENNGQCCNWGAVEAVYNMICAAIFVFNIQVQLLQKCRPLFMSIILQFPLCLYKLNRSMVGVANDLVPQNVVLPLLVSLHNEIHLFIIGGVLTNCIRKCLTMIGH